MLFALLGLALLTANLVLVARLRFIERLIGGLDILYIFHRRLAYVSLGVVAVDVALGRAGALGIVAFALLVAGVLASLFAKVRHEVFIWIQRGLGVAYAVYAADVVRDAPEWIPLAIAGGAAFLYRSLGVAVPRAKYRVSAVNRLDDTVAEVLLKPVASPLSFRAGQFAFLSIVGGNVAREPHPYSIASGPDARTMRFMIKALGDYTTLIQELQPGCEARVEGPFGGFWRKGRDAPRQVWIAGGVGIAPFLSMARCLGDLAVDLYYCTEGPEHAHLIEELFEIADVNPRLRVVPVRKRSLGRIEASDIDGASHVGASKEIFICGPPAMMHALDEQFRALGVPGSRIHFEDFSFM